MWGRVYYDDPAAQDLRWLIDGMKNGTLIWVTDGSYDRKRATCISGAGWIIYCTVSGRLLRGEFNKFSREASSYRAELLGLCALYLLATALEEFYDIGEWNGKLCCDNKNALFCRRG